jgi:ComF family protein
VTLLDFIFPKTCLGCGKEGKYICGNCLSKIPKAQPICPYCKHPSIDGVTHVNCINALRLNGLLSIWEYEAVMRRAILALKYKYATEIGKEISDHLINSLPGLALPNVQYLTPIPIYRYKQNLRGFNQSSEIGKRVASVMGWKFLPDLLIKNQSTVSQTELGGKARRLNLKGAFITNPFYKSLFVNIGSVTVFDDVFTTGSTLMEAGKVLKKAGVKKVWGLTIAR